jgi:hypothetical protein
MFVLLLALIVGSVLTAMTWMRHRQAMARIAAAGTGASASGQVAALEARLRVVERIVTDGGYDLSTQIESLRTPPALTSTPKELVQ